MHGIIVTDTHFNHPILNVAESIDQMITLLETTCDLDDIDVIIHTGDWWDDVALVNSIEFLDMHTGVYKFITLCKKHNIALILLEGTSTHDYHQSKMLVEMAHEQGVTVKYVDDVEVWSFMGYTFLGIPDSLAGGYEVCQKRAKQLLDDNGLTQVDIALTHGMIDYQLAPAIAKKVDNYSSKFLNSIVKYFCANGHNHVFSECEKIKNTGSLFRTKHGEPGDKGILEFRIEGEDVFFTRHVNPFTKLFHTHTLKATTEHEALNELCLTIEGIDGLSEQYLRVWFDKKLTIGFVIDEVRQRFPLITVKSEPLDDDNEKQVAEQEIVKMDIIPIAPNTIADLMRAKLIEQNSTDVDAPMEIFKSVILEGD